MKKTTTFISLLLTCTLLLSSTPLILGNTTFASASTGAANFLPNAYYAPPYGFDTANETALSLATAAYITSILSSRYPCYACYGASCTVPNYRTITSALQNYDKAVVFSKGHRTKDVLLGYTHTGLIASDHYTYPDGTVDYFGYFDYDIYGRTSSKNVVTFMWHCQTVDDYTPGASHFDVLGYAFSLPFAWTHNSNMPKYGTIGSQVYLGWKDKPNYTLPNGTSLTVGSPQYEWAIKNNNYMSCNFANVAASYWYYMNQGYTTTTALNQLSKDMYGSNINFASNTELYNWLVVYGNMDMGLPW